MGLDLSGYGITLADSPNIDAFGRLRVSQPQLVFESIQKYDKQPLFWDEAISGSASSTFTANYSSTVLTTTAASGDSVIRQTKHYFRYSPGRSQFVLMTGNFNGYSTNVTKRIGYYDDQNGIFMELSGGTAKVVRRTYTSGTAVDNQVVQSAWNVDKMDGTGPSGITLDFTKTQIIAIDLEWLGVGRVRIGVVVDGILHYVHYFLNSNNLTLPYMTTAKLPCRYEIFNTGTASASNTMLHTCTTVLSEGGEPTAGTIRSVDTGISIAASHSNVRAPVISLRLKSANIRATLQLVSYAIIPSGTNDVHYEWVLNGTLSGAVWTATDGYAEYDVSATGITNVAGTTISLDNGYFSGGTGVQSIAAPNNSLWIGATIAGVSDVYSLVATPIGTGPKIYGAMVYREIV